MIDILEKRDCCGCTACKEICPKDCISIEIDKEGFWYPKVNTVDCINCNQCDKACPILNDNFDKAYTCESYAAYVDDDEIRLKSSSGGLFTVFANYILENNGIVIGAAFDDDFSVKHIAIENKKDLYKLQGSKYLQSRLEDIFTYSKKSLSEEKLVLFTGTACQIAGLKNYLRKDYNNLYTIDILCHGVPSPKVWKKYLDEMQYEFHSDLQQTFFRQKDFGWKRYAVSLKYKDTAYLMDHHKDPYMRLFLSEICLRPSCHDCHYKDFPHPSDLTIGDAWGIENYMPDMDDDKGTSVLIANSKKGNELLSLVKKNLILKNAQLDVILPPTADSRKSVKPHAKREKFFNELDYKSINNLVLLTNVPFSKKALNKIKHVIKRTIKKIID